MVLGRRGVLVPDEAGGLWGLAGVRFTHTGLGGSVPRDSAIVGRLPKGAGG